MSAGAGLVNNQTIISQQFIDTLINKNMIVIEPTLNSFTLSNLKPFTNYIVFMQIFNQAGDSIPSNRVNSQTLESIPTEPQTIFFSYVTYNNLNLSWSPPLYPNGKILSYEILYENVAEKIGDRVKTIRQEVYPNSTSLYVKDLESKVQYKFQIRCRTNIGWSDWKIGSVKTGPQIDSPVAPKSQI